MHGGMIFKVGGLDFGSQKWGASADQSQRYPLRLHEAGGV